MRYIIIVGGIVLSLAAASRLLRRRRSGPMRRASKEMKRALSYIDVTIEDLTERARKLSGEALETIEVQLVSPIRLGRIELLLGEHPQRFARLLALDVTTDGLSWTRLHAIDGRGPVRGQMSQGAASPSQVLIVEPVPVRGIRIEGWARRRHRWGLAEIRIDALGPRE